MRIAGLLATLALAVSVTAPAWACHPRSAEDVVPILPPAFWSEAPPASELEAGEVVIRATFKRPGNGSDPNQVDFSLLPPAEQEIIIITCEPFPVFTVLDVPAGEDPGERSIVVYPHVWGALSFTASQVLVGRVFLLMTKNSNGVPPAPDSPRYIFIPRPPPEAPLNAPHK